MALALTRSLARRTSTLRIRSMAQNRRIALSSYIVTPKQLSNALDQNTETGNAESSRIIPLCAAWFLPNDGRTGQQVFREKRIPSARFFDLDAVADYESPYPHMLPTAEGFAEAMQNLGIRKDDQVVVYDTQELGIFSAPRIGWTLSIFGHPRVHILNNFRLWVQQGYPTESGEVVSVPEEKSKYPVPEVYLGEVVGFNEMKDIAHGRGKQGAESFQVLDARSQGRWAGTEPEPRPGLSSGHMPGSISVPMSDLLDPSSKILLSGQELRRLFQAKGVDPEKHVISSCGTGVSAAIIDAALDEANYGDKEKRRLYDGSWT